MKICCCTGHRPKSFPYPYGKDIIKHKAYLKRLRQTILFIINEYGVTHFISGMAVGFDMDFAETVLNLRDEERYLILWSVLFPATIRRLNGLNQINRVMTVYLGAPTDLSLFPINTLRNVCLNATVIW